MYYTQVNVLCFQNFMSGNGFLRISNIGELYDAYTLFRYTTMDFFNLNTMSDSDIILASLKRDPGLFPKPEEMSIQTGTSSINQHIINLMLYYYLRDFHGLKGFPCYLHIRDTWDDSLYELSSSMVRKMNINEKYIHQIEFVYATGESLYRVNSKITTTMSPAIEVPTTIWKLKPTETNMDEVFRFGNTERYEPDLMVNTINSVEYPICNMNPIGIGPIHSMKMNMDYFVEAQTKTLLNTFEGLTTNLRDMLIFDDPYKDGPKETAHELDCIVQWITGHIMMRVDCKEHVELLDSISAFYCTRPVEVNDTLSFPYYIGYDTATGCCVATKEDPQIYVKAIELEDFMKELFTRFMYVLNNAKPLLYSLPVIGTPIPPRYVFSVRELVEKELKGESPIPE